MNIYCETCVNKHIESMCATCTRDFLHITTDGAVYGVLSNYRRAFDADTLKATINKVFGISPYQKAMSKIKNVIFNDPATIVFWSDGTKTVVKCGKDDTFDPEKGLAMAISKYFFDNAGYFNDVFKKWIPKKGESDEKDQ